MALRRTWLVQIATALSMFGCGDDGGGGGGGTADAGTGTGTGADGSGGSDGPTTTQTATGDSGDTSTPSGALAELIEARCDWLFACCNESEIDVVLGPFTTDAQDCKDRVLAAVAGGNPTPPVGAGPSDLLVLLAFSHAAGNIGLNEEAVAACAASLRDAECLSAPPEIDPEEEIHCEPAPQQDEACALDQLVAGRLAQGDECEPTLAVECEEGLFCASIGTTGTCITATTDGDFCFADTDCTPPHYCDFMVGECKRSAAIGEPCEYENPDNPAPGTELVRCELGLSCDPVGFTCVGICAAGSLCTGEEECPLEHDCVLGRCFKPGLEGAACTVSAECETGFCEQLQCAGLGGNGDDCIPHAQCSSGFCHPFTNTCSPMQGDGQPCTSFSDVECQDGVCDNADPLMPVCVGAATEGAPCITSNECAGELECISMVCRQTPLANGQPCVTATQCESGLCWQLVCDDPADIGDACTTVFDPMVKPCSNAAYCMPSGGMNGTCEAKLAPGAVCTGPDQCWGECVLLWGALRCDETPPEGEAWCDGA